MAFSNTPANVQGPLISAIALAPPAADFTDGVELGMKKPSKLMVTSEVTPMSSMNAWVDCLKVNLEAPILQNDFATLLMLNGYAEGFVQGMMKTAAGDFGAFLGADSDSETLLGLDWEWKFNAKDDEFIVKVMTEVAETTWNTLWTTSTSETWITGVDTSKRNRPGVKKVTIGGAHLGQLVSVEGSVKTKPIAVQLGRSISTGIEASVKITMAQTTKVEVTAALAASHGSDTVIVSFWDGTRTFKLTNLLGGKAVTIENGEKNTIVIEVKAFFPKGSDRVIINTTPGTFELVFLDNEIAS